MTTHPKGWVFCERFETPDTPKNLLATSLLLSIFQELCSEALVESSCKMRRIDQLWGQMTSCLTVQREADLIQGTGEWHKRKAGMGWVDAAGAPEVSSVLGRQKEPVDADSPGAGAFTQGEHWMGLVCESNVCTEDIQAFTVSRD